MTACPLGIPWTAQRCGKCPPVRRPPGARRTGWPHSGCGWAPLEGSAREKPGLGARGQGHSLPLPRATDIRWAYLAVILEQGGADLPEEGSVFGHVGKAGDDVIKVPGVWDRGKLRVLPQKDVVRPCGATACQNFGLLPSYIP